MSETTVLDESRRAFATFFQRRRLTKAMALRIAADALMLNVALIAAFLLRCSWPIFTGAVAQADSLLSACAVTYFQTFWMLTLTGILVFYLSGFYTHGRAYRGRYKAWMIVQAVTLTYLFFALQLLVFRNLLPFPRTVLFLAWGLTLLLVGGMRLWPSAHAAYMTFQDRLLAQEEAPTPLHNVLVIGGAGYIGSALVGQLLEQGYRVRVLDLLLYGDEPIRQFVSDPDFELVRGDFRHIDAVVQAVQGMDAVVHLGAIVGDSACRLCGELTLEINLRATRTIAEICKGLGVRRFVFASTCSVYGASDELLDERSRLNPISLYARTKVESEQVLLGLADAQFAPTILRFGTIYGLSGRPRFDLVVNLLTAKAIQEHEVGIVGGSQWRPLVHVRDAAAAVALMLQSPPQVVGGEIFNVGSNEQNYQIADLGTIIKQMVWNTRVVTQEKEDDRNYRVRFDKIRNAVGFQPRLTVRDGIAEIMDVFYMGGIADYRDPRYNNYAFLNEHSDLRETLLAEGMHRYFDPISVMGDAMVTLPADSEGRAAVAA